MITEAIRKVQTKITKKLSKRTTYLFQHSVADPTWFPINRMTDIPTRDSTIVAILNVMRNL